MLRGYKVELKPTREQGIKMAQTIGVCRFLYNRFLAVNFERYHKNLSWMSGYDFDKYVNHELGSQTALDQKDMWKQGKKKSDDECTDRIPAILSGISQAPTVQNETRTRNRRLFSQK